MSRGRWSLAIGIALLAAGFAARPAAAAETTFDDTCAEVYGKRPIGKLDKATDPTPGTAVISGQRISMAVQWPTSAVAGNRAHRVMECLSIDGGAPRLWADKQFTTASGTVSYSTVVPTGVAPKSTVCSQTYLKTQGSFGPVTRWSEKTCYPGGKSGQFSALARSPSPPSEASEPETRPTPTTRAPLFSPPEPSAPSGDSRDSSRDSDDYQPPWPPWEKTPRVSASPPTTPTTTLTEGLESTPTTTREAAGSEDEEALPAAAPTSSPGSALPRTGAGVIVLLGIAAVALFSGRTLRRASYAIEDNLPVPAVPVDDDDNHDDPTLILGRRW